MSVRGFSFTSWYFLPVLFVASILRAETNKVEGLRPQTPRLAKISFELEKSGRKNLIQIEDDDGVASLAVIHRLLIADQWNRIARKEITWEAGSAELVPQWKLLSAPYLYSLNFAALEFRATACRVPDSAEKKRLRERAEVLENHAKRLAAISEIKYEDLEAIGVWLKGNTKFHEYTIYRSNAYSVLVEEHVDVFDRELASNPISSLLWAPTLELKAATTSAEVPTLGADSEKLLAGFKTALGAVAHAEQGDFDSEIKKDREEEGR